MDFFFTTICPSLGVLLSNVQLASPFKAVLECRKRKNLGPLNPVPLAMSFVNLFGIVVYGAAIQDIFILLGVSMGILLNFLGCTTAISLLAVHGRYKEVERMERLILTGVFWWVFVALGSVSFFPTTKICISIMGATTCVTTVLYYCSPLSTIRQVVAMQDASSLLFPMLFTNLLSASLWFSYGLFGAKNIWIYLPNACGLTVTILQLVVKGYYSLWRPSLRRDVMKSRMINPSIPNSSDPIEEEVAITSAANSIMGMGLGGLGGIGGVGMPELSEVELTNASNAGQLMNGVYHNPHVHQGYDMVDILSDIVPSAASAMYAVAEDVGQLVMSPFLDTPEEQHGKAVLMAAIAPPQVMSTCGVVVDYPNEPFGPAFSEGAIPVGGAGGQRMDNLSNFSQFSDMEISGVEIRRNVSDVSLAEDDIVSPFHFREDKV